jgi:hypothetical protein
MGDNKPIRVTDGESSKAEPRLLTQQEFARLLERANHYAEKLRDGQASERSQGVKKAATPD